jgi:hypothetical protein
MLAPAFEREGGDTMASRQDRDGGTEAQHDARRRDETTARGWMYGALAYCEAVGWKE